MAGEQGQPRVVPVPENWDNVRNRPDHTWTISCDLFDSGFYLKNQNLYLTYHEADENIRLKRQAVAHSWFAIEDDETGFTKLPLDETAGCSSSFLTFSKDGSVSLHPRTNDDFLTTDLLLDIWN